MDFTKEVDLPLGIPCIKMPEIGPLPSIPLPGGAEIKALQSFADSIPTDCSLNFNIMLQLGPLLGSMACLLKILKVVGLLGEFFGAFVPIPNLPKAASAAANIVPAIADLATCIPALAIIRIVEMIKAIIQIIIKIIKCVIDQIMSIVNILSHIDISIAFGNPALDSALNCQKDNAQTTLESIMALIEALMPIIMMIETVASIAGITLDPLPDLKAMVNMNDPEGTVASLQGAIATFQQIDAGLNPNDYLTPDTPAPSDYTDIA
ncbi:MAG TPA: hypothetical protein VHI13_17050 [Candidatus Kapabacteria bacterium]|nr:hypothetical protein [Candidatus Kapabacteria bacterium]